MNSSSRYIALWLVLTFLGLLIFGTLIRREDRREPEIAFTDFMDALERGNVQTVTIEGNNIQGKYKTGEVFRTFAPDDPDLVTSLQDRHVRIAAKPESESPWYVTLLLNWFPMLLLVGVWIFFMTGTITVKP